MKKISRAFLKGLAAGGLIHFVAWVAERLAHWSVEEFARLVGHVIVVVGLETFRRQ